MPYVTLTKINPVVYYFPFDSEACGKINTMDS